MRKLQLVLILLMAAITFAISDAVADTGPPSADVSKSFHLYHRLGNDGTQLTRRGTITIKKSASDSGHGLVAEFQPDESAQLDIAAFDHMVEKNALYTLVVVGDENGGNLSTSSTLSSPPSDAHHVSASVPGCSLRRANLREEITLSLSPTGKLMSVSYRPLISPLAPATCETLKPLSEKPEVIFGRKTTRGEDASNRDENNMPFKTTVAFESHNPMMAIPTVLPQSRPPPGLKWYRRNSKSNPSPILGGNGKEGGGPPFGEDEKPTGFQSSFLYKYWYIILPMAIMGLFGGSEEEEDTKGGQARGGNGQPAPGRVTAAEALVAEGVPKVQKQRRGKRD